MGSALDEGEQVSRFDRHRTVHHVPREVLAPQIESEGISRHAIELSFDQLRRARVSGRVRDALARVRTHAKLAEDFVDPSVADHAYVRHAGEIRCQETAEGCGHRAVASRSVGNATDGNNWPGCRAGPARDRDGRQQRDRADRQEWNQRSPHGQRDGSNNGQALWFRRFGVLDASARWLRRGTRPNRIDEGASFRRRRDLELVSHTPREFIVGAERAGAISVLVEQHEELSKRWLVVGQESAHLASPTYRTGGVSLVLMRGRQRTSRLSCPTTQTDALTLQPLFEARSPFG